MKRVLAIICGFVFMAALAAPALRAAQDDKMKTAMVTVTGQVVDVACNKKGSKGPDHDECAMSCAKRGQPAGVEAADGVYVITGQYADNKNEKLIEFVNKNVTVKGTVTEKDGQKMIDVTSIAVVKAK